MRIATLTGIVDPFSFTPERNFGAGGQARRLVEINRAYTDENVVRQKDVYALAREVAEVLRPARVVDLGSGDGQKLPLLFDGYQADFLQVDWKDQRQPLDRGSSGGVPPFFAANLEDAGDIDRLAQEVETDIPTLFILADVIQHLDDPRWLLRLLRRALRRHPHNRLIISTPDRHCVDGRDSSRIPDNPEHFRQWTLNEFGLALLSAGFRISRIGRVQQNDFDLHNVTIAAELSCREEDFLNFLSYHHLPPQADHLVLTTEHGLAHRTGGIGTYHKLVTEATQLDRIIMFTGSMGLPQDWRPFVQQQGWLHTAMFGNRNHASLTEIGALDPVEILQATIQALFLYDTVRLVEYQDYLGIGVHVAQAKRARLLPPSVCVVAYAHGTQFYLNHAAGVLDEMQDISITHRERLSLELADCVIFASDFLRNLYLQEWRLNLPDQMLQRYPLALRSVSVEAQTKGPISTLIFHGKQTPQKGYPDFCDAVVQLFENPAYASAAKQVQRVVLIGVETPDPRLEEIPGLEVENGSFSLAGAIAMLERYVSSSLVVLPYRGDNHPLSIFEVIDSNSQLLAYRAGGIPEIIPETLHQSVLCDPNPTALAAGMARAISMSFQERLELLHQTREKVGQAYLRHNESYRQMIANLKSQPLKPSSPAGEVSVIVPNLNGEARFFHDLLLGLRNTYKIPEKVVLVDDGSTPENLTLFEETAARLAAFMPTEVIRHPENLGLPAARNTALARVDTPYVCAHDNDNIVLNIFLHRACRILDENPDVAAVTTWMYRFFDHDTWLYQTSYRDIFHFPGPDLAQGIRQNCFGDALAVYRTEVLKRLGGWDASSKATWEDWQLFLRLTAQGEKILVIPHPSIMYRERPQSMVQTYPTFPGRLRLARCLESLPANLTYGLVLALVAPAPEVLAKMQSMSAQIHSMNATLQNQQRELERLRPIEASTTWRATAKIRGFFTNHPLLKDGLKKVLRPFRGLVK